MGIFRRGKNSDEVDTVDAAEELDAVDGVDPADGTTATDLDDPSDLAERDGTPATEPAQASSARASVDTTAVAGPFDAAEVEDDDGRLDLGALRIMGVPGMELRLEIDETANQVVGATAVIGDSAVQIQAFAAPRTMGIWDDIRSEIAESILAQGGTADESRGPLGTELRTRMPSAGPDGRTVFAPARFAGVDGPRWFLRAVFSGRAAIEDEAAEPLLDVVRGTVVVRGDAAMAPREMLVLKLPDEVQTPQDHDHAHDQDHDHDHAHDQDHDHDHAHDHDHDHDHDHEHGADATAAGPAGSSGRVDDLKPFERGPEITEVR